MNAFPCAAPFMVAQSLSSFVFFFTATATSVVYTLSLHDALPISCSSTCASVAPRLTVTRPRTLPFTCTTISTWRSEEHTSELQSHHDLVCRLLLEKKK